MDANSVKQYIRYIELDRERVPSFSEYPFNLPAIKNLQRLSFHPQVTFIVGENGSGKSTILESIADHCPYCGIIDICHRNVIN
ncbi:AAA family ATPase [Desulfosporosinus sp. SYSU MS00001]|uniref:AAA family ATPase n=1 Tax=Desulfosporosinus sp. SYSU MS00001 TaxID=3416284 RepID=UPI003CF9009F